MIGLTKKQHDMLTFIMETNDRTGIPPSFDEMMIAAGLRSKSNVHRIICALEERGHIRRLHGRARAIEVLQHPERTVSIKPATWALLRREAMLRGLSVDELAEQAVFLAVHVWTNQKHAERVAEEANLVA